MSSNSVLAKLKLQGVVGAEVKNGVLLSCTSAPASFTIPAGIVELADFCLSGQDNLRQVFLINNVSKVGTACFANCPKLVQIICNPSLRKYHKELKSGNHAIVIYREG